MSNFMTKKIIIFILLFHLILSDLYCQESSEGMAMFDFEIERLILNKQRNQSKEIKIRLKSHQISYSGKWQERVKYKIINDSIIKQTLQNNSYYGLISNGEIISIDYNEKLNLITKRDKIEKDSLSYKISKILWVNGNDTNITYCLKQLDPTKNISKLQYTNYYTNPINQTSLTEIEIFGDTLYHSKYSILIGKTWTVKSEWSKTWHKKDSYIEEVRNTKVIDQNNKEKIYIFLLKYITLMTRTID